MPNFHDMIKALREPDENGPSETIYDDLVREYDTAFEGYTANTNTLAQQLAEKDAEVARLKSANYDLLMSVGTGSKPEDLSDNEQDKPVTFDDLFTKK